MAEYVSKDQFEEFVKRMEQGFAHMDQRFTDLMAHMDQRFTQVDQRFTQIDQRFTDLMAHMGQRFTHIDQRFTQVDQRTNQQFVDVHANIRELRGWIIRLYGLIVFGFIGTIVLAILKDKIFP